jgi:uncharacterized membrane protein YeaQ/YmgE (transglycosylase-associated protein family)
VTIQAIVIYVLIGIGTAFVVSWLLPRSKFGQLGDLLFGVAGSFLGGWVLSLVGAYVSFFLWPLIAAFAGALVFLSIPRVISLVL